METTEIINLGKSLGLNYIDITDPTKEPSIINDCVVFTGVNGQHFIIDSKLSKNKIYLKIGEALISYGKRLKAIQITNALSQIND